MTSNRSIFLFHRSLRLLDNTGLNQSLIESEIVFPMFIFDPRQIESHEYRSKNAIMFLIKSLKELDQQLRQKNSHLLKFYGNPLEILKEFISKCSIDSLFMHRDYTPFARDRSLKIKNLCNKLGITFHLIPDYLLNEPESIKTVSGTPYSIFTPFYNKAKELNVPVPSSINSSHYHKLNRESLLDEYKFTDIDLHQYSDASNLKLTGGRKEALELIQNLSDLSNYGRERDYPALDGTSHLSAHLKFGTVSIREVYYAIIELLGHDHPLIRQLYWRDFFTHIAFHFPHVFGHTFREKYNNLEWNKDHEWFQRWTVGTTGFPIVDAGMRELLATGYMHNRVRMIVASFLTKDLHLNWLWGEKHFAEHLVDYDPAVNNGNWQWAASTGCDAQPYFRIFNPWSQQQKFDRDAVYIKTWIPELKKYSSSVIHKLWETRPIDLLERDYPKPMVNHKNQRAIALAMFKNLDKKEVSI